MKQFDFDHPDFRRQSESRQQYLIQMHDQAVTEEEYMAAVASWPKKELHNSSTRRPSAAKSQYRSLVKNFGFFNAGQTNN